MKSALIKPRAAQPDPSGLRRVLPQVQALIEMTRQQVAATANLALVNLYWNIGRVITQDIQRFAKRADYGTRLLERLGEALAREYGRGYTRVNLQDMRRFFEQFEIRQPAADISLGSRIRQPLADKSGAIQILPPAAAESADRITIDFAKHFRLGWTHYRILLSTEAGLKRGFYFEQAAQQRWSKRELQRQIDRALFERVALSCDTKALVRLEKQRGPAETARYEDAFKDPYLLDFLGLKGAYSEKDFESAILANLQQFLSELGSDFCFVARQFAMRIDDDDYWLDLLFYHRRLRCLVAVDLKIGPFVAADKGQMDLYLSWLKAHDWREGENEPVGLILCTSKKRQHVELLLGHGPHKMQVSEYRTQLPTKRVLEDQLKLYSRLIESEDAGK